jgi:hypothetical protein
VLQCASIEEHVALWQVEVLVSDVRDLVAELVWTDG